jgi:hypothetical protein
LNNFVVEHVNTEVRAVSDGRNVANPIESFASESPREGWIFISMKGSSPGVRVTVNSTNPAEAIIATDAPGAGPHVAMRRVGKGSHTINVFAPTGAGVEKLIVRSIPEIIWFSISFADWENEASGRDWFWKHEWDFVQKHLLPNGNALAFSERPEPFENYIETLHAQGKLALMKKNIPPLNSTEDQIYQDWAKPLEELAYVDGVTIDEFTHGEEKQKHYPVWGRVFDRIAQNPATGGKKVYAFTTSGGRPILPAVQRNNFRWLHEGYYMLGREVDREEYPKYIERYGGAHFQSVREEYPGLIENNLIFTFGIADYHWSFDITADRDFKVFLDMQFHHIANHPSFEGMFGVCMYLLAQTTEEMARYASTLIRHYCIEGNKERFNHDPIELRHLKNPGFEQDTADWKIQPAGKGSVVVMDVADLPYRNDVTDRAIPNEKKVLCTTRSIDAPNMLSQRVTGLKAGQYYSLRVLVSDLTEYRTTKLLDMSINIDGVEPVADKTVDRTWTNYFTNNKGPGSATVCWNYHSRVFRAKGTEATLTLSDWAGPDSAGDEPGHQVIWDLIKLQPYFVEQ